MESEYKVVFSFVIAIAVVIIVAVICGSTYCHKETMKLIESGYCQTEVMGQSSYLWQKCK